MKQLNADIPKNLKHIVKDVAVLIEDSELSNLLPFYADGFPGIVYHINSKGMLIHPFNKYMPNLFLFGITVEPIQIEMHGKFLIFIIQLYPYVLKNIFNLEPNSLLNDCFDFNNFFPKNTLLDEMNRYEENDISGKLSHFFDFMLIISRNKQHKIDYHVRKTLEIILNSKGQESIKNISQELNISKRTIERKFNSEIGIPPKQFTRIIKFQNSIQLMHSDEFVSLSDIVFENNYFDQSHFTKNFKEFTKMTPNLFLKSKN